MKHLLVSALLLAAGSAFAAGDIDIVPYGYVTQAMRDAAAAGRSSRAASPAAARAQVAAETREAARRGLLHVGEGDPVAANIRQSDRMPQPAERAAGARPGER